MSIEDNFDFKKIYKTLGIKKNDKVVLCLSSLKLIFFLKKRSFLNNISLEKKIELLFCKIIDELKLVIGKKGTILIPTYNWDFCKGKIFDYHKSPAGAGSIGNYALKRKDFKRSRNPIYSFAVNGYDQNKICNLKHFSCFGLDSPFGYLIKKGGKNIFIGFDDYRKGFHFPYIAEEKVGVKYRFLKTFSGKYKIKKKIIKNFKTKMNVRKLDLNVKTKVDKLLKIILMKNSNYKEIKVKKIPISILKIDKAFKIMVNDLKNKKKLIYPIKI